MFCLNISHLNIVIVQAWSDTCKYKIEIQVQDGCWICFSFKMIMILQYIQNWVHYYQDSHSARTAEMRESMKISLLSHTTSSSSKIHSAISILMLTLYYIWGDVPRVEFNLQWWLIMAWEWALWANSIGKSSLCWLYLIGFHCYPTIALDKQLNQR